MMKRIFTMGTILMLGQMAMAQFSHNFTHTRGAMMELSHPTEIGEGELLTDLEGESFRIGFEFKFNPEATANVLRFTEDGMLEAMHSNGMVPLFTLSPMMGVDMIDRGTNSHIKESNVYYEKFGSAGERILVVQWLNVGFQEEYNANHTTDDFMNIQMVLNEKNNKVEYTYGLSRTNNSNLYFAEHGPSVGLASEKYETQMYLSKLSNNPKPVAEIDYLMRYPQFGTTYGFMPKFEVDKPVEETRLSQGFELDAKIYPNPCANEFNIKLADWVPNAKVVVRSPYGKVVYEGLVEDKVNIDLTGFDSGLYVIQIYDKSATIFKKVLKR